MVTFTRTALAAFCGALTRIATASRFSRSAITASRDKGSGMGRRPLPCPPNAEPEPLPPSAARRRGHCFWRTAASRRASLRDDVEAAWHSTGATPVSRLALEGEQRDRWPGLVHGSRCRNSQPRRQSDRPTADMAPFIASSRRRSENSLPSRMTPCAAIWPRSASSRRRAGSLLRKRAFAQQSNSSRYSKGLPFAHSVAKC